MNVFGWLIWCLAAVTSVWALWMLLCLWRDRRRPVRGADGRWRAPEPPRNGWGRP